jgi:hypothetical protein
MPKSTWFIDNLLTGIGSSVDEIALFTSDPTTEDVGDEVSGGSYARQAISWDTPADGGIANDTAITFSNLPACTITHWAVYGTTGDMWYFGRFEIPILRTAGQNLEIAIGSLYIAEV